MRRKAMQAAAAVIALLVIIGAGLRFYTGTDDFAASTGRTVAAMGTELLETRVEVEGVRVDSLCSASAEKIVVFDKQNKKLAEAESAKVRFSLFSLLFDRSAAAVSEVIISKPQLWLEQRPDGKWNYEDIISGESKDSGFRAKVIVQDGSLELVLNDKESGQIKEQVGDIQAAVKFNDGSMKLEASAAVKGEKAAVAGEIFTKDKTKLDLTVTADNVDIGKVMENSPFAGKVTAKVKVSGPTDALDLRGEASADSGSVYGYAFKKARAKASFGENILRIYELTGEIFDGQLTAAVELDTTDLKFDGTARLKDMDMSLIGEGAPGLEGRITADLGFAGYGADGDALSIYGSIAGKDVAYEGIRAQEISSSFAKLQEDIAIDYLSVHLPDNGTFGVEGTIKKYNDFDLKFYSAHFDLNALQAINPSLDMQGYADFRGKLRGNKENPDIWLEFAAIKGALFKQPFRTLHGEARGSLDGLQITNFALENGAQDVWMAKGSVGFTGEKRINLQIDTVGARMEDLAAFIAPGQPITGNLDNIIMLTGTIDNPDVKGYIHFYNGSYNGYLLQGMDGDYTVKNGIITLQDFHIFSPMVDMELNGTVDRQLNLDLKVEAKDLSLDRYGSKLPYPINGHGRFDGHIGGNVSSPLFDGLLTAGELNLNGCQIINAHGKVNYRNGTVKFDDFGFNQNDGRISLTVTADIDTMGVSGLLRADKADLNALMAMADLKNDIVHGRFDGTIQLGGKATALKAHLLGNMPKGDVRGYEFYDLLLDATLDDRLLTLNTFSGKQGPSGVFVSSGSVDFNGPMNLNFSAKGIQAGIIPRAAGADVDLSGLMDIELNVHGTVDDPVGEASVEILSGGLRSAGFDSMKGLFSLKHRVINVDQFIVEKKLQGSSYKLSAYGALPLAAFRKNAAGDGEDQFNLKVVLSPGDLSLLGAVFPQVDWAMGETTGEVLITGTMNRPLAHGSINMAGAAMKLKKLGLPVTDMNLQVNFDGDSFTIADCSGRIGKGTYSLNGLLKLDGRTLTDYGLTFNANKLEIISDVYKGPLSAELKIGEGTFYRHTLPQVSGNIFIEDATISLPSVPESDGELPDFIVDFSIKLGKKVRFYSPYVGDFRLDGAAHFGGTTRFPQSSGHIAVARGKIYYLKTPFTVRRGALIFNNAGSFLPSVDFFADTKLNRTKVFMSVRGPVDKLNLKLRSSPEMRQSEIIKLLTFRTSTNASGRQETDYSSLAEIGLQMAFLGELEGQVRSLLNLDEFSISRDTDGKKYGDNSSKEGYNIEMGKYISDKVMIKYIQGFAGSRKRRVGVQYDFNDRMSVSVLRDEYNAFRFGLEARFRF